MSQSDPITTVRNTYIAVDFDGTIVDHRYPDIGDVVPGAIYWLTQFKDAGAKLVLWTMRSDGREKDGDVLSDAVRFCSCNGVDFDYVNQNPQKWTTSPKAYAQVYIDDAAFGCPLVANPLGRPYVDWSIVGPTVLQYIEDRKNITI